MKKQIILTILILFITLMLSIFIYELLNNLNSDILINLSYQDNLISIDHVSVRDTNINNTNTNSTITYNNNVSTPAVWIITIAAIGGAIAIGGIYGLIYFCAIRNIVPNETGVEMDVLN